MSRPVRIKGWTQGELLLAHQLAVFDLIKSSSGPVTIRHICEHLGYRSHGGVLKIINQLRNLGIVERDPFPRPNARRAAV